MMTRSKLAKLLEISPFTLRNWVRDGYVSPTLVSPSNGRGYWSEEDAAAIRERLAADRDV